MKLALLVVLSGCSIGIGGAYVGKHAARRDVQVDACLVDDAGTCVDRKQIVRDQPARHFWGALLAFPAIGGASVTSAGMKSTEFRAEPSLEVLSGYGRLAWGVRGSWVVDGQTMSFPFTAIGHVSVAPRLGLYAGLGYAPWAELKHDRAASETSAANARALAGVQIRLGRNFAFSLETDSLWLGFDGGYHSYGFTGHLGLFF